MIRSSNFVPPHILETIQGILVRVVLDEAETTRRLGEPVQAHHQPLDLAAFAEERVDLLFGRVEGEVADVEGCGVAEFFFEVGRRCARGVVCCGGVVLWAFALFVLVVDGE